MATQKACSYLSSEIIIESENIRRYSKDKNKEAIDNHLTLLEKEFDKMILSCEALELAAGKETLKDIRNSLSNEKFDTIEMHTKKFEKDVLLILAKKANDDSDPLDIIPSRVYSSL